VLGSGVVGLVVAVGVSSVLFGLAHTEQGTVGVVVTFPDALLFSFLRLCYRNLWAPVLAHGFSNTIGLGHLLPRRPGLRVLVVRPVTLPVKDRVMRSGPGVTPGPEHATRLPSP
jgi:membrane protease YdiL (CAAX protease family)